MSLQELYKITKIDKHFTIKDKIFELRRNQNPTTGNWTDLGLYHIKDSEAVLINMYFLDSYVNYTDNQLLARAKLESDIERSITRYIRFGWTCSQ